MQQPEPIRVAQVLRQMNMGGIEAILLNYYRAMDKERVQFDFLVEEGSEIPCRAEMEALGSRVFTLPPIRRPGAYAKALRARIRSEGYRIVHANMNTLNAFALTPAWREGVPVRISHNHSTANSRELARYITKGLLRPSARAFATHRFACSRTAGAWMFGEKAVRQGRVQVMHNAIDLPRFAYDPRTRARLREALGLGDALVVGHVGRFCQTKNQAFAVECFAALHARRPDARLLLVGVGETLPSVLARAASLGVAEQVLYLGARTDVHALYAAMDGLLLPSLYEGMPVVGIEAQASALPCVFSEHVPREAGLLSNVRFLPLKDPARWADALLEGIAAQDRVSVDTAPMVAAGYDIHTAAERLTTFYEQFR